MTEDVTRFTYELRMEVDNYTDPRIRGRIRSAPPEGTMDGRMRMSHEQLEEVRRRTFDYLRHYEREPEENQIVRVVGYSPRDIELWIQDEETLTRIEEDLGEIVNSVLQRSDLETTIETRALSWNRDDYVVIEWIQ